VVGELFDFGFFSFCCSTLRRRRSSSSNFLASSRSFWYCTFLRSSASSCRARQESVTDSGGAMFRGAASAGGRVRGTMSWCDVCVVFFVPSISSRTSLRANS